MLKDALRCLKQLSLYLQSTDARIINAMCHIDDTHRKLLAMKTEDGRFVRNSYTDQRWDALEAEEDAKEGQIEKVSIRTLQSVERKVMRHTFSLCVHSFCKTCMIIWFRDFRPLICLQR